MEQIVLESLLAEITTTVAWVLRLMHKLQVFEYSTTLPDQLTNQKQGH